MHVRVRTFECGSGSYREAIVVVPSRLSRVDDLRPLVREKFAVELRNQRLLYGGKLLEDGYTLHDYGVKLNDVIQLIPSAEPSAEPSPEPERPRPTETTAEPETAYEDVHSEFYKIGDLVDVFNGDDGWIEGKIIKILMKSLKNINSTNDNRVNNVNGVPKCDPVDNILSTSSKKDCDIALNQKHSHANDNNVLSGNINHCEKDSPKTQKHSIKDYFVKNNKSGDLNKNVINVEKKNNKVSVETFNCKIEEIKLNEENTLIFKIQLYIDEIVIDSKLSHIRPRARRLLNIQDIEVNQTVMINHNLEDPYEKGYWYDYTVHEIIKHRKHIEFIGALHQAAGVLLNEVKIKCQDKIFAIEKVEPLRNQTKEYRKKMTQETEKRNLPLNCKTCRDDVNTKCKDCGCSICAGKHEPHNIILCDECNSGFHLFCLDPPMQELPEDDWYCSDCKRNPEEVIAPGKRKQQHKTNQTKSQKDWGRGMACVGKTQTCTMPANHFGPIPGIEVGMTWRFRIQLSESGVHRPPVSGIHGRDIDGAYSIVLSGGYEDDTDNGYEFTYTGSGGRDLSGNKRTADQSSDQILTRENRALARNCAVEKISEEGADAKNKWKEGKPVRVVRSYKMLKHFPTYAPKEGIRYDGIYKVVKYYPEKGKSGFRVWKYLLRRDDPSPAPWEKNAKIYPIVYPDGYLEAEAEKRVQKEKQKPTDNLKRKRVLKERNGIKENQKEEPDSPPLKRLRSASSADKKNKKEVTKSANPKGKNATKINQFVLVSAMKTRNNSENTEVKTKSENIEFDIPEEDKESIKKDTINVKLWEECLLNLRSGGKKEFIKKVTELFLCIICQDIAAYPVTMSCGHNFCKKCLQLAFKSTQSKCCPYCRNDLGKEELSINEFLQSALRVILPGYDVGKK